MRSVSVVGIGQLTVEKASALSLRQLGAEVVRRAMEDAGVDRSILFLPAICWLMNSRGKSTLPP